MGKGVGVKPSIIKNILVLGCILNFCSILPMHEAPIRKPEPARFTEEKTELAEKKRIAQEEEMEKKLEEKRQAISKTKVELEALTEADLKEKYKEYAKKAYQQKLKEIVGKIAENFERLAQAQELPPALIIEYKTAFARTIVNRLLDRFVMLFDFLKPTRIKALENERRKLAKNPAADKRIQQIDASLKVLSSKTVDPDYKKYITARQEFYKALDKIKEIQNKSKPSYLQDYLKFDWSDVTPEYLLTFNIRLNELKNQVPEYINVLDAYQQAVNSAIEKREKVKQIEDHLINNFTNEIKSETIAAKKKADALIEEGKKFLLTAKNEELSNEQFDSMWGTYEAVRNLYDDRTSLIDILGIDLAPLTLKIERGRETIELTKNPYDVLGLKKGAIRADMETAYSALKTKYTSIENPNDAQKQKFKDESEAYEILHEKFLDQQVIAALEENNREREQIMQTDPARITRDFYNRMQKAAQKTIELHFQFSTKPKALAAELLTILKKP